MKRAFLVCLLVVASAISTFPAAAQSGQTVNVIMLDMTALMGPGYVGGYGITGPNGMMMGGRYGYGMMAPGTMMCNRAPGTGTDNDPSPTPLMGMMAGMMSKPQNG